MKSPGRRKQRDETEARWTWKVVAIVDDSHQNRHGRRTLKKIAQKQRGKKK